MLRILWHQGVQLAYSWARPAIFIAGKDRRGLFLFFCFFFHSCSSFFPVPVYHLLCYVCYLFSPILWEMTQNDPQGLTCHLNPNTINQSRLMHSEKGSKGQTQTVKARSSSLSHFFDSYRYNLVSIIFSIGLFCKWTGKAQIALVYRLGYLPLYAQKAHFLMAWLEFILQRTLDFTKNLICFKIASGRFSCFSCNKIDF